MDWEPVRKEDIPKKSNGKKKYAQIVEDFWGSNAEAAAFSEHEGAKLVSIRNGLHGAIQDTGLSDNLEVFERSGKVYLVRKDEMDQERQEEMDQERQTLIGVDVRY